MSAGALAVLLWVGLAGGSRAAAQPSPAADRPLSGRVVHVRVAGDLDSMALAKDFDRELARARDERAGAVLVELDSGRWRLDVLAQMAHAIEQARALDARDAAGSPAKQQAPLIVAFLRPGGAKDSASIGGGQALLSVLCDARVLGPGCVIEHRGEDELADLYPPGTDAERSLAELRALAVERLKSSRQEPLWSVAFPVPAQMLWWTGHDPWKTPMGNGSSQAGLSIVDPGPEPAFGGGALTRLEPALPSAPGVAPSTPRPNGEPSEPLPARDRNRWRLSLPDSLALRLGFACGTANSPTQALARGAPDFRSTGTRHVEIRSRLGASRTELDRMVRTLDDDLRKVDADVREAGRSRSIETLHKRRRAGDRALADLDAVEARLQRAETLLADFPELLLELPPGQTRVGQARDQREGLWRRVLQGWRDRAAETRARARTLSEAKP